MTNSQSTHAAQYAGWIAKLEGNLAELARMRKTMYPRLLVAQALSLLGFAVSVTWGLVTFISCFWICGVCIYVTTVRGQQFREELERTRDDMDRIFAE